MTDEPAAASGGAASRPTSGPAPPQTPVHNPGDVARAELVVAGRRFQLACAPGQQGRLEELGVRFDERVRALAEALGDLGPERLFLAAGLSLLDELDAAPAADAAVSAGAANAAAHKAEEAQARLAALESRAVALLAEAAARIDQLTRRIDRERP